MDIAEKCVAGKEESPNDEKKQSKLTPTNLRHSDVTSRFRNVAMFVAVNP